MFLGIDFGTSGCRAILIDGEGTNLREVSCALPEPETIDGRIQQDPAAWVDGLENLLGQLGEYTELAAVERLALDATSGTVLLTDHDNRALTPALMYHDCSSHSALQQLHRLCPNPEHTILSASSALAKAMQLHASLDHRKDIRVCPQADFLLRQLGAPTDHSDYHNAFKLGFDVERLNWPEWILELLPNGALPNVVEPGQALAQVDRSVARRFGLNPKLVLCAGSTDANAAFIATGASQPGNAVTSLGSTLVVKLMSEQPIEQLASGVYSHRLGDLWLTGGGSNAGGNILRRYFSNTQLDALSARIDPQQLSGLDYYPLPGIGERFPILDPKMQPRLEPRPDSDAAFLHGLLEGLARIEGHGYRLLQELGAPPLHSIQTLGGGAANETWRRMRENLIGAPVSQANQCQAAYGSALLALRGLEPYKSSQ